MSELTPELLEALAAPFPSDAISWKPQTVSHDKTRALAVAYIDARDVAERLDSIVGGDWAFDWEVLPNNDIKAKLTICGVTRADVGERTGSDAGDTWKAAVSDGLKRAAVLFGIGRYLYRLPKTWVGFNDQRKQLTEHPPLPDWALPEEERGKARPALVALSYDSPAPAPAAAPNGNPGSVTLGGGKYKGQTIAQIGSHDVGYLQWMVRNAEEKGKWYPDSKAAKEYLESLNAATAPEPLSETASPFAKADNGVGNVKGVTKGTQGVTDADNTVISAIKQKDLQGTILAGIKAKQIGADWDDAHLVGHIAKHFALPVRPGVDTAEAAILKMTRAQARTLYKALETVAYIKAAFKQHPRKPFTVITWVNDSLGKSFTERKGLDSMVDELTHDERVQLKQWVDTAPVEEPEPAAEADGEPFEGEDLTEAFA